MAKRWTCGLVLTMAGVATAAPPATVPSTNPAIVGNNPPATTVPARPTVTPPGTQPAGHVPLALPVGAAVAQPSGVVDGVHRLPLTDWRFEDSRDGRSYPAVVPGDVHLDLLRNGRIADPFYGTNESVLGWVGQLPWTYRTTFDAAADVRSQPRVELVLDGVDTDATVTLNGQRLGATDNMFLQWRFDVKPLLKERGNELTVAFGLQGPRMAARKQSTEYGWDFSPSLVTVGLYRPAWVEAGPATRVDFVGVHQTHEAGRVTLKLSADVPIRSRLTLGGVEVANGTDTLTVDRPELWWPNGMGGQPLYDLTVTAANAPSNTWHRRIGLRTIVLDRRDEPKHGQSFTFVVNGRPMFAKGANVVPPHVLAGAQSPAVARALVDDAADANMNMLRVWSGGYYPLDDFYDRADERGVVVWQEFPFLIYKDAPEYRANLKRDVRHWAQRLQSHASLGLWCGNNEGELLHRLNVNRRVAQFDLPRAKGLVYITQRLMPDTLAEVDPDVSWLPSSPHMPVDMLLPFDDKIAGDLHEWSVWGGQASPHEYEQNRRPRFASEFGNQSLSSAALVRRFCPADQLNLESPTMVLREKSGGAGNKGNHWVQQYAERSFGRAKDFDGLVYQSQQVQAWSNSVAVRLWRRQVPHCMGSLIWQLNDTWPGTTWAIVNFDGSWKPAMYQAKRDYAPAIVMATIPDEARDKTFDTWKDDRRPVRLTTAYDGTADQPATVRWAACRVADGSTVREGSADVVLRGGVSTATAADVDLTDVYGAEGDAKLYLRYELAVGGTVVSGDTFWFVEPKAIDLPRAAVTPVVAATGRRAFGVTFTSPAVQCRYTFDLPGVAYRASDNSFDLYPGQSRTVDVTTADDRTAAEVQRAVVWRSLADTE